MRDLIAYALYSLVGLIGILLVFSAFSDAESEAQVQQLQTELLTFVTEIRKAHRGHPDLYGAGNIPAARLITAGIAPETTVAGAALLRNSFGGDILVTGATTEFSVDFGDIPQQVCIQTLARLRPDDRVTAARVAANMAGLGAAADRPFPLSLTQATAACGANDNAIRLVAE